MAAAWRVRAPSSSPRTLKPLKCSWLWVKPLRSDSHELHYAGMGSERREGFHPVGQDTAPASPGREGLSWLPPEEHLWCLLDSSFLPTACDDAGSPFVGQDTNTRLNGGETTPLCPPRVALPSGWMWETLGLDKSLEILG